MLFLGELAQISTLLPIENVSILRLFKNCKNTKSVQQQRDHHL